jgi:hypothetical protein
MRLSPQQRAEVLALNAQSRFAAELMEDVQRRLRRLIAGEEALRLAVSERLGYDPVDGCDVEPADDFRAQEILRQCWADEL